MLLLDKEDIIGLYVYLEKRKSRIFVGELIFDKTKNEYCFTYNLPYLFSENIIPMGPELPLTNQQYFSNTLFPSFIDRIPSRLNPAYVDYCNAMGISINETDPIILLSTIGKRGPSSFIYEPHYKNDFDHLALKQYRLALGLTLREFAHCFEITQAVLSRVEQGKAPGKEILKRIEIYAKFPHVAYYQIQKSGGALHSNKQKTVLLYLAEASRKKAAE